MIQKIFDKSIYRTRNTVKSIIQIVKWVYLRLIGVKISYSTTFDNLIIAWPHQLSIAKNCTLEGTIYFKFDGIWCAGPSIIISENCFIGTNCEFNIKGKISVAKNSLIGSNTKFIDHDHGMELGVPMNKQDCPTANICIEEDVWLGVNVVVLKGVTIGTGAVVAAGAIVNKSIPAYEIWGGVPAKKIGDRRGTND